MYHAALYKEDLKRNNSVCVFKQNDTLQVGKIVYIKVQNLYLTKLDINADQVYCPTKKQICWEVHYTN